MMVGILVLAIAGSYLAAKHPQVVAMVGGIDPEIWHNWIVEKLFASNKFLDFARKADDYVVGGRYVHIPQAGSASAVEKNRSVLPATVTKRTDTDILYALDEFTSDPRLIENAAKILSYNKMDSAMGQDLRAIIQLVAREMLYNWAPAGDDYIVLTTGSNTDAHLPDATGNRKLLELKNLDEAAARMDELDIPDDERYALFSARMHKQFIGLLSATQYRDFSSLMDPKKGIAGEYAGFKILKRSSVLRFADGATPVVKAVDAANETTDCDGILCWHPMWVERALGQTTIFQDQDNPLYYGDIYSLLVRAGGRKTDADGDGVIAIVQDVG